MPSKSSFALHYSPILVFHKYLLQPQELLFDEKWLDSNGGTVSDDFLLKLFTPSISLYTTASITQMLEKTQQLVNHLIHVKSGFLLQCRMKNCIVTSMWNFICLARSLQNMRAYRILSKTMQ